MHQQCFTYYNSKILTKDIQAYTRNGDFEKTLMETQLHQEDENWTQSSDETVTETGSGSELEEQEEIVEYVLNNLNFEFIILIF